MQGSDKTRIAKNTMYLYVRKLITIFIGLYSARILLLYLGIDDYGLYGLCGSVVVMFGGIRSLFTEAIQRHINVEKGGSSKDRIRLMFTYGVLLNFCISVIFIVVVEVGGIITLPRLDISPDKLTMAFWILQFSILSAVLNIMTTPYDAIMIANEKFNAFAFFSILSSLLNLISVLTLSLFTNDKVVIYAFFTFIVALIFRITSAIYCKYKFREEVKYLWKWDKALLRNMTLFSGWNAFGTFGYSIFDEGLNFILNIYGGLVVNGARAVAIQVRQTIAQFNLEALAAFKPQTMAAYGKHDFSTFTSLINISSKFSFTISAILSFILAVFAPSLLKLWLSEIPEYSVIFIRVIMIYMLIRGIHNAIDLIFKSTAKLKQYQIWEMSVSLLALPIAWLSIRIGAQYYIVFVVAAVAELVKYVGDFVILKKYLHYPVGEYLRHVVIKCITSSLVLLGIGVLLIKYFDESQNILSLILGILGAVLIVLIVCIALIFNQEERSYVLNILRRK